jgi:hypothetical protein
MRDVRTPVLEARPLTEDAPESDIDKMLHDYVKPTFIRMSAEKRQKAIDVLKQMAEEG